MSNFNEVQNEKLRAYNRVMYMTNLKELEGDEPARMYGEQFSHTDKMEMITIIKSLKARGTKKVRDEITHNILFSEYPTDEEKMKMAGI